MHEVVDVKHSGKSLIHHVKQDCLVIILAIVIGVIFEFDFAIFHSSEVLN